MENLEVVDFGPIKHATIRIKKYNIFIGHTSSGKSIIAKLIAIVNSSAFWSIKQGEFKCFEKLLLKYNINFDFTEKTQIKYCNEKYVWEIGKGRFTTTYSDADLMGLVNTGPSIDFITKFIEKKQNNTDEGLRSLINMLKGFLKEKENKSGRFFLREEPFYNSIKRILLAYISDRSNPVYIPAERLLISTFTNSIFSLLQAGASIPDCIKDFGSLYEKARTTNRDVNIEIMNIKISFSNEGDSVWLKDENKQIKLIQSSSGIQAIVPLWTVFNQFVANKEKQILVLEEPELNLFPTTQVSLINWIMKVTRKLNGNIVITTHSPYVLSAIDNLILASKIVKKKEKKILEQIMDIMPSFSLVNFEEISSYFFSNDGNVKDILDKELQTVGAEYIDEASNNLSEVFEKLCNIEYNEL